MQDKDALKVFVSLTLESPYMITGQKFLDLG